MQNRRKTLRNVCISHAKSPKTLPSTCISHVKSPKPLRNACISHAKSQETLTASQIAGKHCEIQAFFGVFQVWGTAMASRAPCTPWLHLTVPPVVSAVEHFPYVSLMKSVSRRESPCTALGPVGLWTALVCSGAPCVGGLVYTGMIYGQK